MAVTLAELVDPATTAVVTSEVQKGVVGPAGTLPALTEVAAPMLPNVGRLVRAARAAGAQVVHATVYRRADGRGANRNARLFAAVQRSGVPLLPGTPAVEVVDEVGVEPEDLVLTRT
ncbi:MAG TPA: isochorismatase family protein, partial [Acidimicrobiales bacterium]